jgi:hypothetical protein
MPRNASILYQDLVIRLAVKSRVTIGAAPLVLEGKDGEAVCWLTHNCGKPLEETNAKGNLTYVWHYHGDGIYLSQERVLQLPNGQNGPLEIDLSRRKRWNIRIRSQMLR